MLCPALQEDAVLEYQQRVQVFWDTFKTRLQAVLPAMTLEDLKYARSLVRMLGTA